MEAEKCTVFLTSSASVRFVCCRSSPIASDMSLIIGDCRRPVSDSHRQPPNCRQSLLTASDLSPIVGDCQPTIGDMSGAVGDCQRPVSNNRRHVGGCRRRSATSRRLLATIGSVGDNRQQTNRTEAELGGQKKVYFSASIRMSRCGIYLRKGEWV